MKNFIDEERIIHIDSLPLHNKYGDLFLYTDVPEAERTKVAMEVADKILTMLKRRSGENRQIYLWRLINLVFGG